MDGKWVLSLITYVLYSVKWILVLRPPFLSLKNEFWLFRPYFSLCQMNSGYANYLNISCPPTIFISKNEFWFFKPHFLLSQMNSGHSSYFSISFPLTFLSPENEFWIFRPDFLLWQMNFGHLGTISGYHVYILISYFSNEKARES